MEKGKSFLRGILRKDTLLEKWNEEIRPILTRDYLANNFNMDLLTRLVDVICQGHHPSDSQSKSF